MPLLSSPPQRCAPRPAARQLPIVLTLAAAVIPGVPALTQPGEQNPPTRLRFRHHYVDRELPGDAYGQTSLLDVDRDGDRDFITGQRRGDVLWYEYRSPERWVRHLLGKDSPSDVGGAALDVDGDGWPDHVAGGAWYRNTGRPREEPFERLVFDDLPSVHDLLIVDVDGDGRADVVTMSDRNNLRWYRIPVDPRQRWERHDVGPSVHAGIAAGDLDGDGDLDLARSNAWFENRDGRGGEWTMRANIPFGRADGPYPLATRAATRDMDGDGDLDLVMTEGEIRGARAAWIENADGRGGSWRRHDLAPGDAAARGAFHSLQVADFDGDADLDVFTCEMEGIPGERPPRWYIWENLGGRPPRFAERVVLDTGLGGHEAVAADVDGDGDLDLCSKLWRPRKDNANGGRNHADFLENLSVGQKDARKGAMSHRGGQGEANVADRARALTWIPTGPGPPFAPLRLCASPFRRSGP